LLLPLPSLLRSPPPPPPLLLPLPSPLHWSSLMLLLLLLLLLLLPPPPQAAARVRDNFTRGWEGSGGRGGAAPEQVLAGCCADVLARMLLRGCCADAVRMFRRTRGNCQNRFIEHHGPSHVQCQVILSPNAIHTFSAFWL